MFNDRIDAGQQLCEKLLEYKDRKDVVIMALPRGGVVPAYVIASGLHLPLEVTMVKKLGHPTNHEYAIGAVSLTGRIIDNNIGVGEDYIDEETRNIRKLLKERFAMYHGSKPPLSVENKTVIVVDDGVATGKTMIAALELLKEEKPKKIVVAVPVGPEHTINLLNNYADEVICLESDESFYAIGQYYRDFRQVSDDEVKNLLSRVDHAGT